MSARSLPGLGLKAYWPLGTDGWNNTPNGGVDENFFLTSIATQLSVLSLVATVPTSPVNGDIHIITGSVNKNDIAARDNGVWRYITPIRGWRAFDRETGTFLVFNGMEWEAETHSSGGALIIDRQVFTANGVWNKPAGLICAEVIVQAAGASAGGPFSDTAGSGAGGGCAIKMIAAEDLGSSETVTVPAAPNNGSNSEGVAGGSASFGTHCSANGGGRWTYSSYPQGGNATGGDINIPGGDGLVASTPTGVQVSVTGGDSMYGKGSAGANARGYGAGGGYASTGSRRRGAPGVVIVTNYIQQ